MSYPQDEQQQKQQHHFPHFHLHHNQQQQPQQQHSPHHQLHSANAVVQAANTLSSIGSPVSASTGNMNQQHHLHMQQQQQQHHQQQQGSHLQSMSVPASTYSPTKPQHPPPNQGPYGGGGNQYESQEQQAKRAMSFRGDQDTGIRIQQPMQHQQQHHHQHHQSSYNEYGSSPPVGRQQIPPQQQYQQHPQQQQHQQQPQSYQAYSGGSTASRQQAQSTGILSRTNTMGGGGGGMPGQLQQPGDPSSKYLPIASHHQASASTSALPMETTTTTAQSSMSQQYTGSGLGMSGTYGDVGPQATQQIQAKEGPRGSQWNTLWSPYAVDWCKWPIYGSSAAAGYAGQSGAGRVAVGSASEDGHNYISILNAKPYSNQIPSTMYPRGEPSIEFQKYAEATLTYPITRVLWEPPTQSKPLTDLLATSGDHLRLWSLPNTAPAAISTNSITSRSNSAMQDLPAKKLSQLALLSNSKSTDFTAPLTSLDWNPISPSLIITSSIDTTCTIWDIPTLTAKTQLIAHDKEVFDVRFMSGSVDVFASCGADGSVRMFDLRSLDHSTIIYEPAVKEPSTPRDGSMTSPGGPNSIGGTGGPGSTLQGPPPLLRLAASPHESHLIATFSDASNVVRILDVRQPGQALIELRGHTGNINCIEWCPYRRGVLAGGGDDCLILLWDLLNEASQGNYPRREDRTAGHQQEPSWRNPIASWRCDYEVNNLSWAPSLGTGMSSVGSGAEGGKGMGEWLGACAGRSFCGVRV